TQYDLARVPAARRAREFVLAAGYEPGVAPAAPFRDRPTSTSTVATSDLIEMLRAPAPCLRALVGSARHAVLATPTAAAIWRQRPVAHVARAHAIPDHRRPCHVRATSRARASLRARMLDRLRFALYFRTR